MLLSPSPFTFLLLTLTMQLQASVVRTVRLRCLCADRHSLSPALWIGINDCCFNIGPAEKVADLFERAIKPLYERGIRYFVIFEVPPRMRPYGFIVQPTPGFLRHHAKIDVWNQALLQQVASLEPQYTDIRAFIFPAHALFLDIFENPGGYGFSQEDVGRAYGGKIWMDGLHPTSAVHSIIADRLIRYLS